MKPAVKYPFVVLIAGKSGVGKTTFTHSFLECIEDRFRTEVPELANAPDIVARLPLALPLKLMTALALAHGNQSDETYTLARFQQALHDYPVLGNSESYILQELDNNKQLPLPECFSNPSYIHQFMRNIAMMGLYLYQNFPLFNTNETICNILRDSKFFTLYCAPRIASCTTHRELLQYIGTDVFRKHIHENIWCDVNRVLTNSIIRSGYKVIVVDDIRFSNEILLLMKARRVLTISMERTDYVSLTGNHASEKLDFDFPFDVYITSKGNSADQLKQLAGYIASGIDTSVPGNEVPIVLPTKTNQFSVVPEEHK